MTTLRWIPAMPAAELGTGPAGLVIDGLPIVLFRDSQGRPHALLDRCPHRWVPLSLGRCAGDRLVCAYHGWEFDGEGRCLRIPSNLEPEGPPLPRQLARAYPVEERDGELWLALEDAT